MAEGTSDRKIRVLVVDDSAVVRGVLGEILKADPELSVVGVATDPYDAREKIKALSPDVLTLDVEMPNMDGLTFLSNLMRLRPMPVVMVSSLTADGAPVTLDALALGAVDFVEKPTRASELARLSEEIVAKVKSAARARLRPRTLSTSMRPARPVPRAGGGPAPSHWERVVALGASTGGTEAIKDVLEHLSEDSPPILIAQHIPAGFSQAFAERLDKLCAVRVTEAEDGEPIAPGNVYVAPGSYHLTVAKGPSGRLVTRVTQTEPVNRHRPSVDVLFDSFAKVLGAKAVGVLLTGMGADGAKGLREMRARGAATIAQDRETSVIWGMPGEAVKLGAADEVVPLSAVASRILARAR